MNDPENFKQLLNLALTASMEIAKTDDKQKTILRDGVVAAELIAANVAAQSGVSAQTILMEIARCLQKKAVELNIKEERK